ncbi:restriction endonuclease subunit S [Shewanella sp. SM29]|uniref:restriction endonuclease subunit S n=1 Tax=Shewanella TaxID=22 RepID=UPI0021DA9AD6|nr:restriction endonuclease subunit S [Shewanella sp. SM29]MCU8075663.1 restriction endonuclease subunit S [Shewanella sp. SM29]
MSELPKGWASTKFTKVLDVSGGTQPPKSEFIAEPKEGYIRLLQIRDFGSKPVPTYIPDTHKLRKCTQEDILIGRYGASIGRICTGMEGAFNVALAKVVTPKGIDSKFLKYYLKSELFQNPLAMLSRSAQNGFNKTDLSNFDFWLAPLNEQIRIADKLDSILAKVDQAQARLEKIPHILKRFRQSVLAAATSGELTREWREEEGLRIDDWANTTLSKVATALDPNPSHRYPKSDTSGVPILSTQQFVGESGWTTDKAKLVNRDFYEERKEKTGFFENDIIFARKGRLGLARFAPTNMEFVFSHTVFIIRASDKVQSDYLLWYLKDERSLEWLVKEMNSNTGVPTLGKGVFEKLPIHLPSIVEQSEISSRIEQLLSRANKIEKQYLDAKARLDRLTQSILAKAFRGELVSQDPNDESADKLLKNIKAEHPKPKGKKK